MRRIFQTNFLLTAILFCIFGFGISGCGRNSPAKLEEVRIKSILINCRAFATDHDENYPSALADLHPKYSNLVSNLYSPPFEKHDNSPLPFHFRTGLKVGAKVDEPLVISPQTVKGKVNVGYLGGFIRRLELAEAQKILNQSGWSQSAPPIPAE
jgi:hypothetical protein